MTRIKRIEPFSLGKLALVAYAVIGLIAGALFSLLGFVGAFAAPDAESGMAAAALGLIIGVGAVVVMPLVYGIIGFCVATIAALLYNVVASITGGIVVELE